MRNKSLPHLETGRLLHRMRSSDIFCGDNYGLREIGSHSPNVAAAENKSFVSFGDRVLDDLEKKLIRKVLQCHLRGVMGLNAIEDRCGGKGKSTRALCGA